MAFCSAANAIQRPLMMQMASFIAVSEGCRLRINKLVTAIGYFGVLLGYFGSGLLLTYSSYEACFLANAAAYGIFLIFILFTRLPVHKVREVTNDIGFRLVDFGYLVRRNTGLLTIYAMALALWLTGGSINVLEIPFAKKAMGASDGMVSMLFFATASGSILYSSLDWRLPEVLKSLSFLTVMAAILIAAYVGLAKFGLSLPILFCFGFLVAIHGVQSVTQLQNLTSSEDLSNATIVLNTLNQTVGLIAAALGVVSATFFSEQSVCLAFAMLTFVSASLYGLTSFKRGKVNA
ncbi:MAG: MFS transporter [Bdellovibrionales bacterium]